MAVRRIGTFWVMHLDWPPAQVEPRVPAVLGRAGAEVTGQLAAAMGAADEMRRRLESGGRCYAAWVEGDLAAYGWVSFGQQDIGELQARIILAPGEAYLWDCVTLPPYRRRRLYTALLVHIAAELRAERLCRLWIGADLDNVPSRQGIALAGFRPVADALAAGEPALRLLGLEALPGIPASWVADLRRAVGR